MNPAVKKSVALAAAVGSGLLAERLVERTAANRLRGVVNDDLDPLLVLPDGVTRDDVPTHDGGSVHVITYGTGTRPLVLIHGVTMQGELWSPLLHLLGDRFRIHALDVRGHGASVVGTDGIGRLNAARDVRSVLEHFDLTGAVLMGHSMGGMIIGEFCGAYPDVLRERVAALVFMNTAVSELAPPALLGATVAVGRRLSRRVESGKRMPRTVGDDDRSLVMSRVAFGAHPSGAAVEQVRRLGAAVDQNHYLPLWVDLLDYDGTAALDSVDLPALVLAGSRDRLLPVSHSKRIVEHLRNGELHVFPAAGHQLMQERPREVAALLIDLAGRLDATDRAAGAAPGDAAVAPAGLTGTAGAVAPGGESVNSTSGATDGP